MESNRNAPALFAPGPAYVPERIRAAMAEPITHHRSPQYKAMFGDIRERLKRVWRAGADWEPLVLACSGSGAMEGAVVNFMSRDSTALVVSSGKFGERWTSILRAYGCRVVEHRLAWGKRCDVDEVAAVVREHPDLRVAYLTSADTSTGIKHPVEELGRVVRELTGALVVVDCICDFGGGRRIRPLEWRCDALVSSSQKCLLLPPGLGLAHLSPRAVEWMASADLPRYYFDWRPELEHHRDQNLTHFTSPVTLHRGLQESLTMIEESGLERVELRYERIGEAIRAGLEPLGLEVFPEDPSDALTVARCPAGLDGVRLVAHVRERYGVQLGNGQDSVKGKVFRIGHMGVFGERDVVGLFGLIERALDDFGHLKCRPGEAVAAVARSFHRSAPNEERP